MFVRLLLLSLNVLPTFLCLLAFASGVEINDEINSYDFTTSHPDIQKDLNIITYIHNFKEVMANYVIAQYNNLTVNEMEQVKEVLAEFLGQFATDLRDTIEGKNIGEVDNVDDGLPDKTFVAIKEKIFKEFPEVEEDVGDLIIKKLRRNLYATRLRLFKIIHDSEKAQLENSQQ